MAEGIIDKVPVCLPRGYGAGVEKKLVGGEEEEANGITGMAFVHKRHPPIDDSF